MTYLEIENLSIIADTFVVIQRSSLFKELMKKKIYHLDLKGFGMKSSNEYVSNDNPQFFSLSLLAFSKRCGEDKMHINDSLNRVELLE